MARYEHLPIYRRAFDLCVFLETTVQGFSRYQKHALGADLRQAARAVLRQVVAANSAAEGRRSALEALRLEVEELAVLVRLAREVKAFPSLKTYETCANHVVDLARQNEGWLRSLA